MAHKTIHTHIRVQAVARSGIRFFAIESLFNSAQGRFVVEENLELFERRDAEYPTKWIF